MATLYDSPLAIRALLDSNNLGARKRWGQNFLINPGLRQRLVESLEVGGADTVWEVGPGLGAMTQLLLDKGLRVTAFEIDPAYCRILSERFADRPLRVVAGDVLQTWKQEAERGWMPILGNLPYNIAATLLGTWAEEGARFPCGVFLVQKELADRMSAPTGSRDYSSFSVLCQSAYQIEVLFSVAPGNFYPRPEVMSVALRVRPKPLSCTDLKAFGDFLRLCFHSRRQTLRNNLGRAGRLGWSPEGVILHVQSWGIDPGLRAEDVSVSRYLEIWTDPKREERFRAQG